MVTEEQVLGALRRVTDPDLHRDIVELGFVKDLRMRDGEVSFTLLLTLKKLFKDGNGQP